MSRKRREQEQQIKQMKRKQMFRRILIGAGVVCVSVVAVVGLYLMGQPKVINTAPDGNGDLAVPLSQARNDKITYVRYGGAQDLLVWLDGAGQAKTAFDTCEECFSTGSAHYTQQDSTLICDSCGNSVSLHTLGEASWGGCQPVAIPLSYRQDTEGEIVIPSDVLDYAGTVFSSWRGGDYTATMGAYDTGESADTASESTDTGPGEGEEEEA